MKLLNQIKDKLANNKFDLDYESRMVQSRILSPIIEEVDSRGLSQKELSEKTGLTQPFISALFNIQKSLNTKHIAKFQNALGVVLQSPQMLSEIEHSNKFYEPTDYISLKFTKMGSSPEINETRYESGITPDGLGVICGEGIGYSIAAEEKESYWKKKPVILEFWHANQIDFLGSKKVELEEEYEKI